MRKLKSIKYSSGDSSHHEHLSAHDDQGTTLPSPALKPQGSRGTDKLALANVPKHTHTCSRYRSLLASNTNRFDATWQEDECCLSNNKVL